MAIIRHSGVVFEGDQGKKYAHAVELIVESVATGLEEVAGESGDVVRSRFLGSKSGPSPGSSTTRATAASVAY